MMINKIDIRNKLQSSDYYNRYHLRYFLQLERELENIGRYIDLDKKNFRTFSFEILKLYQAICSEIDAIAKIVAYLTNNLSEYGGKNVNIQKWRYQIQNEHLLSNPSTRLQDLEVIFNGDIIFIPFNKFEYKLSDNGKINLKNNARTPKWWVSYNKVKHGRPFFILDSKVTNYSLAYLKNLLTSFSALFVLMLLYEDKIKYEEKMSIRKNNSFFEIL